MAHPVPQAKEAVSAYYSKISKAIEDHYRQVLSNIKGGGDLLQGLEDAQKDEALLADYKKQITAIQNDISSAKRRKKFRYRVKGFFAFFFPNLLRGEIFADGTTAHMAK